MAIILIQDRRIAPLNQRVVVTMPMVSLHHKNHDARVNILEQIGAGLHKKIAHSEKFVLAKK
jgi:hypothetical protein